jgi:hypothetical protein
MPEQPSEPGQVGGGEGEAGGGSFLTLIAPGVSGDIDSFTMEEDLDTFIISEDL